MTLKDSTVFFCGLLWGTLLGIVTSLPTGCLKMIVIVIIGLLAVVSTFAVFILPAYWPNSEQWTGKSTFFKGNRFGREAVNWDSGKQQAIGDEFTLDIGKRHPTRRARLVSQIHFMAGGPGVAFPESFAVSLLCGGTCVPGYDNKEFSSFGLDITLAHPVWINYIIIRILKPRKASSPDCPTTWATNTISIMERRLFWDFKVTPYDV